VDLFKASPCNLKNSLQKRPMKIGSLSLVIDEMLPLLISFARDIKSIMMYSKPIKRYKIDNHHRKYKIETSIYSKV
jgi:hypothetical protein